MSEIDLKFMKRNAKEQPIVGTIPVHTSNHKIEDFADRMTSPIGAKLLNPDTGKPIDEIILDASKEPSFKGHDGVLNECFGENIKKYGHQSGMWEARAGEDWGVWFPKFLTTAMGSAKAAPSGWVNTISDDGLTVLEYKENGEGERDYISEKWFSDQYIRLVFAYIPKKDRYVFKGAFVGNTKKSKPFKHVFSRVATKVKIIGKPAYAIWLLDEDRSNVSDNRIEKALDDSASLEEREKQASQMNLESLKVAAINHSTKIPLQKDVIVKQISRDPYISEYAKKKANGVCQLCGQQAPFNDKNGKPYLESHHVIWLSKGGPDSIDNIVALCPNCHKKMHIVDDANDVHYLISRIKES